MEVPWVEKYRPSTLDDLVTRTEVIETLKRLTQQNFFPHLLLFGPPGTGKTSAILAIGRTLYGPDYKKKVLELNASDERGIDVVRNCIQDCAKNTSLVKTAVGFKLIILDECDNMTKDAQMALRRMMEDFTSNARFCLMCNHPNNLIPAIRSRCAQLRFPPLEPEMVQKRLQQIVQFEQVKISVDGLDALIAVGGGDMRQSLNTLQFLHLSGDGIGVEDVYTAVGYPSKADIKTITHHLLNSDYQVAHESISALCTTKGHALIDILREVAERLMNESSLPEEAMVELIAKMSDYEVRLSGSSDENLQLLGLIGIFIKAREEIVALRD